MKKILFILFLCFGLSNCIFVPAIASFNKLGVAESDRMALLPESVKKFQDSLYWGQTTKALAMAVPESRAALAKQVRAADENLKIVESKVKSVDFADSAYKAEVFISVKSYKIPYYVVSQIVEKQTWIFTLSDGWRIDVLETVDEKSV